MNRNLKRKKRSKGLFGGLLFIIFFGFVVWRGVLMLDNYDSYDNKKVYPQSHVDSLVNVINKYKEANDSYYNRLVQLEQNINQLKNNLTIIQDTVDQIKKKKNEKPNINSPVIIRSEIPKFLPDRYNKNK